MLFNLKRFIQGHSAREWVNTVQELLMGLCIFAVGYIMLHLLMSLPDLLSF